ERRCRRWRRGRGIRSGCRRRGRIRRRYGADTGTARLGQAPASPPATHPRRDHHRPRAARWRWRRLRPGAEPARFRFIRRTDHAIQETAGALRRHAAACHAVPSCRPGVGRAHRLAARPGEELAPDGLRLPDACAADGRRPGVALGAIHRDALRRGGGQRGPGTRRGRSRHAIPAQRCADRAPHRALRDAGALAVHRLHRRPPELAGRLRLHDRQGRGRAQRLRAGQRPVRAHRQGVGDGADHQCRARQRYVFQRALDGAPLRQRRRGGPGEMDGRGVHRAPAAAHRRTPAQEPPGHLRQRPVVEPRTGFFRRSQAMNDLFRKSALPVILLALAGCATQGKPPPTISLDEPVQAQPLPEPPAPVEVVAVPEVLSMPAQLKPLPEAVDAKPAPEPADEKVRVSRANSEARVAPTREGYVNAIQVWPFTDGALYQVYAAVGRVTVISLQPGEELVTVAAGDTVRWIVGDTSSGSGAELRVNVLVKPIRSGLKTNLVITTNRRTYLLELASTEKTWMASVSWEYPRDRMLALQRQA